MDFCPHDEGTDDVGPIRDEDQGGCSTSEGVPRYGIPSADVDLEGRVTFFPALPSSTEVFVCELLICMEIDQSPRFTRRVMNFQSLFYPGMDWEDPYRLSSAHP